MILVCGEALVDVVSAAGGSELRLPGGGPFNTARGLGRLGAPATFLGRLSTDADGRDLAAVLRSEEVSLLLEPSGEEPTTRAQVTLDAGGVASYAFLHEGTAAPQLTAAMVPDPLPPEVDAVYVAAMGLVLEPMATTLRELILRGRGKRLIMVDPGVRPGLVPDDEYRDRLLAAMSLATVVKASEADLDWMYPAIGPAEAAQLILDSGPSLVVVTRGRLGALGITAELRRAVPAPEVEVVDTIGAGDAFSAALLARLHETKNLRPDLSLDRAQLESLLEYACRAAAISCTRAGAQPPWRSEMEDAPPGPP